MPVVEPQALKLQLKNWESAFQQDNGRAATREDVKKVPAIYLLYKQYNSTKKGAGKTVKSTSQLHKPPETRVQPLEPVSDTEPEPEAEVSIVKATPRHGRVLGLFDLPLPRMSPRKDAVPQLLSPKPAPGLASPKMQKAGTPQNARIATLNFETPEAARTPEYLYSRTSFVDNSPAVPRRSLQYMTVQPLDEASLLAECGEDETDSDSEDEFIGEVHDENARETGDGVAVPVNKRPRRKGGSSRSGRRGGRTRAVVLRPVLETDKVSRRAQSENYQKLNIAPKRGFKR